MSLTWRFAGVVQSEHVATGAIAMRLDFGLVPVS